MAHTTDPTQFYDQQKGMIDCHLAAGCAPSAGAHMPQHAAYQLCQSEKVSAEVALLARSPSPAGT